MKNVLVAGDTLDFLTTVAAYPASAGWLLSYRLTPRVAGQPIAFSAAAEGDSYRVKVGNSQTAGWAAGEYSWFAYVAKNPNERYTVDQGTVTIKPDPAAVAAYDGRTHARKMLEAIETALEGFASNSHIKSYTIGSRTMTKADVPELMVLRDRYKNDVASEEAAEAIAAGGANPRYARVRFNNA